MKHIFIVNPNAGKVDATAAISAELESLPDFDFGIHVTTHPGNATEFVRDWCIRNPYPVRFYACGGDGTLNEVVNGAVGFEFASVGCYPCGSGNDYVKYYGTADDFRNMSELINGPTVPVDLIKVGDKYGINACHFGFDTAVARTIQRVKHRPIIGGKRAYTTAVIHSLLKSMRTECTVYVDGNRLNGDKMLLCTIANGSHVGGSFKCAPRTKNNDGLFEVCLCLPVSRFKFVRLVPVYTAGRHLDTPSTAKVMRYTRGRHIEVIGTPGFGYSLDGEVIYADRFEVDVVKHGLNFIVPQRLAQNVEQRTHSTAQSVLVSS